jgi:flagellar biosynthesis protein FliQ
MTPTEVSAGAWIAFGELAGPALAVMLVIGLATAVLQTMTQIRESSVPFITKLAGFAVLSTIAGPLMLRGLEHYTVNLYHAIPGLLHG